MSIRGFLAFYERFRGYMHTIEVAGGLVMIAAGTLIFTRHFVAVNDWLNRLSFFRAMAEKFL
jgi:hypothetical protein